MIVNVFATGYAPKDRLLLVGVRTHTGEFKFFSGVKEFVDYFIGTDDKIVIGFNILKWDILFLLLKSQELDNFNEFFKKINYSNIVDLYPILTFRNKGVIKGLSFYLEQKRVSREFLGDVEISRLLESNKQKAEENIVKKLESLKDLYWRLKSE